MFEKVAMSVTVVRTVVELCTTGTISAPVNAAAVTS